MRHDEEKMLRRLESMVRVPEGVSVREAWRRCQNAYRFRERATGPSREWGLWNGLYAAWRAVAILLELRPEEGEKDA